MRAMTEEEIMFDITVCGGPKTQSWHFHSCACLSGNPYTQADLDLEVRLYEYAPCRPLPRVFRIQK